LSPLLPSLVLLPVPVLPFAADPFEQPAPIKAIMAGAARGHGVLFTFLPVW
jgi:hypothetical protein